MRLDNRVAYATTGIFVIAMLFVGAEFLHSANVAIASGDKGLIQLGDILEDEYGAATAKFFLIGFFATSFTSLIGVWHGVSLMFADFVARLSGKGRAKGKKGHAPGRTRTLLALPCLPALADLPAHDPPLRGPALPADHHLRRPRRGLPALPRRHADLAPELLPDTEAVAKRPARNVMLAVAGLLFLVLCVKQIWDQPWGSSSRGPGRRTAGGYGSPCTCGPTASDHALPAVASQLVDQVIAPRRSGYVRGGLKEPQPEPLVRQSRALFTTDGET
ncbi:hypothetical protein SVIOM74S_01992 [Streptomyces violarus]